MAFARASKLGQDFGRDEPLVKGQRAPLVSVVMPVYNDPGFISQAIESILKQTLTSIELIIVVEKGADDDMIRAIENISDARILCLVNDETLGLIASLNRGFSVARGRYIARMDSDDISLPTRLEKQVVYLEANPEIGVLGTRVWYIDGNGKKMYKPRYFTEPGSLAWDMFFNSPIPHPTAMMRAELATKLGGYDRAARLVEDYDLWMRAAKISKLVNLPEELVLIRKHGENITMTMRDEQNMAASQLAGKEMERLLRRSVPFTEVHGLRQPNTLVDGGKALKAADLLNELYAAFISSKRLNTKERSDIKAYVARQYSVLISIGMKHGWGVTSELLNRSKVAGVSEMKVIVQSLLRRVIR